MEVEEQSLPVPETWPSEIRAGGGELLLDRYWRGFGSAELDRLVDAALESNYDLRAVAARVRQAGFGARVAWSERFPSVGLRASVARTERRSEALTQERAPGWTMELGVAGQYEVDLWGRMRARHRSETAELDAARWDFAAAQMTLVAEVTLRWIDARVAQAQLALLDAQAQAVSASARLLELRYRQGEAAWTDVLAQRQTLQIIDERRATTRARLAAATAELRLLVAGQDPALESADGLPELPPLPEAGLPATLLERRPDVRAAWYRVAAAAWAATARRAERLPTLNLAGTFAFAASTPESLFETWIASLLAGLTGPLFDFWGRKYAAEEARAAVDEALAELRQALLAAFRDVERALSANRFLAERALAARSRAALARERAEQLEYRYRNGMALYLDLYVAEVERIEAEQAALAARADLLIQRVQLARALGGGWRAASEEEEKP